MVEHGLLAVVFIPRSKPVAQVRGAIESDAMLLSVGKRALVGEDNAAVWGDLRAARWLPAR